MTKQESIDRWKTIVPHQEILPHMNPIPYKSKGSRYGACGIRIDGNPAFIDAVLSRLKDLLDGESTETRLELARNKVDGSGLGKSLDLADIDAECCYIRLHERGGEGKIYQTIVSGYKGKLERKKQDHQKLWS